MPASSVKIAAIDKIERLVRNHGAGDSKQRQTGTGVPVQDKRFQRLGVPDLADSTIQLPGDGGSAGQNPQVDILAGGEFSELR